MATLIGEWGFLDNLDDTSGNGRNATLGAGTLTYVDGPQAGTRGIKFSSADDYVDLGRTGLEPALGGVTVMGWVRFEGSTGADTGILGMVSKARAVTSSRARVGLSNNGGTRRAKNVARWKDDLQIDDLSSWSGDGWHHLCMVDGNTTNSDYVDGVLALAHPRSLDSSEMEWEPLNWLAGRNVTITDVFAHPQLSVSGIRIFSGELTETEVQTWMDTPVAAAAADNHGLLAMF
jgi:hypothetical protein